MHCHAQNQLFAYVDFHAHASKKGCFMFGNHIEEPQRQVENVLLPKLVAMNCLNFDMNECNFSERIMSVKDKNGMSREGSGRVAVHKESGIAHCYTLECNYHNGKRINFLSPKLIRSSGNIEAEMPVTDQSSKIYCS